MLRVPGTAQCKAEVFPVILTATCSCGCVSHKLLDNVVASMEPKYLVQIAEAMATCGTFSSLLLYLYGYA